MDDITLYLKTFRWAQEISAGGDRERSMLLWSRLEPTEFRYFLENGRDISNCEFQLQVNVNSKRLNPSGELGFGEPMKEFPDGFVYGGILVSQIIFDDLWERVRSNVDIVSKFTLYVSPVSRADSYEVIWKNLRVPKLDIKVDVCNFKRE